MCFVQLEQPTGFSPLPGIPPREPPLCVLTGLPMTPVKLPSLTWDVPVSSWAPKERFIYHTSERRTAGPHTLFLQKPTMKVVSPPNPLTKPDIRNNGFQLKTKHMTWKLPHLGIWQLLSLLGYEKDL